MLPPAPLTFDYTHQRQTVTGYLPKDDGLKNALTGADVIVIPAGIPRKITFNEGGRVLC
jgi:malate/lactate dehydrogenase